MNKKKLKLQVLNKIKEQKLEPTPKWHFMLKDWVVWAVFGLSILIGAMAFSVSIFMIKTNDWEIRRFLDNSLLEFTFKTLPYIWILLFIGFTLVAYFNLRHTKKGYKYNLPTMIIVNLLATVIMGYALFGMGAAKRIDSFALDRIPAYQKIANEHRRDIWTTPERGLLAGEIKKVVQEDGFTLIDFKDNEWTVTLNSEAPAHFLEEGLTVQVIGEKTDEFEFTAERIKPWQRNLPQDLKRGERMQKHPMFKPPRRN